MGIENQLTDTEVVHSHIGSLMDELGIDTNPSDADTDGKTEIVDEKTDVNQKDLSVSNDTDVKETKSEKTDTEPDSKTESLQSQISGMEKRISDKDDYIKKLQEQIDAIKKADKQNDDTVDSKDDYSDIEEEFWDKPAETIKALQNDLQMQKIQLNEAIYANGKTDYYETVNGDSLKEAVSADPEFAQKFASSKEPHKVAYEYLTAKKAEKTAAETAIREALKAELRKEIEEERKGKQAPASLNGLGSGSDGGTSSTPGAIDDGFSAVFG